MSDLPKRFPDRTEIAVVRAAAAALENGANAGDDVRVAGRVMARRDMGNRRRKSALTRLDFRRVGSPTAFASGAGQSPPPRRAVHVSQPAYVSP